jgi:HEPN domain-containing protein
MLASLLLPRRRGDAPEALTVPPPVDVGGLPSLEPVLEALRDARLAEARSAYEEALRRRLDGDRKALEAAVIEAAKAVESSLKALLVAHHVKPPRNPGAGALLATAVEARLIQGLWEHAVLAASGPRNLAGHGRIAGDPWLDAVDAETALASAAIAIHIIARKLP